jgi:hypothetical protein
MTAPLSTYDLSFEQTVPRSLVHRAALGEVYVADSRQLGDGEYALAIQVPRAHCVWFDRRAPYHDPLSTAEAARQGVYVVVHRHIGVPAGMTFSLRRLEFRVETLECYRDRGTAPLQGVLVVRVLEQTRSGQSLGTMAVAGHISLDGGVAMTFAGDLAFLAAEDFAALRAFQRRRAPVPSAPPATGPVLDPVVTGRLDRRNSVIAEPEQPAGSGATRYPVVVDQHHPSFFDHAYDHAPGPLIVEAYRQAAIVTACRAGALSSPLAAILACEASFASFAELDARIDCDAAVARRFDDGRVAVKLGLRQFDKEIATGSVELGPYPAGTRRD